MPKITKTEKALLKAIVDTNCVKPHHIRKSELRDGWYRTLWVFDEGHERLTVSHAIKPRLFSGLKVEEDYLISELLEEEDD